MRLIVAPPSVRQLLWSPPPQTTPTVANMGTGFFGATYAADEDVILVAPPALRTQQINVNGGRNIRIIGGKTLLDPGASGTAAARFTGLNGSIFLEGYHIDCNGEAGNKHDGVVVTGSTSSPFTTRPDVYFQNCRGEGVMSTNSLNHADIFQPQGAIGHLYVDRFTGMSNYQGFFIRGEFPIGGADFSRMNLAYEDGGDGNTFLFWGASPPAAPYPVTLNDVWVQPRAGQNLIDHAVWPKAGEMDGATPIGAAWADAGHTKAAWPSSRLITGYINSGTPPKGDFVPANRVGLGYVSPGYRS